MRVVVALLLASGVASSAQSVRTLSTLTVPVKALPGSCALKKLPAPAPVSRGRVTTIQGWALLPFPTNPWSGTDPKIVTEVRKAIDGAPKLPDGPPLEAREAAALELKLAANVLEAYHAAYASSDGSEVEVFAATFDDTKLAKPDSLSATMAPPRGLRSRVVRGATVIVVSARSSSECALAVDRYIRSLK